MTSKTRFGALILAGLAAAMGSPAYAEGGDSAGFRISLTVPEVCDIEAMPVTVEAGANRANSSVFEMCNSSRGFAVFASHRGLAEGERVQLDYDGSVSELDPSGLSEVAFRQGPTVGSVPVSIRTSGLAEGLTISLGMTAI